MAVPRQNEPIYGRTPCYLFRPRVVMRRIHWFLVTILFGWGCREGPAPKAETGYWLHQIAIAVRTYEADEQTTIEAALVAITTDWPTLNDRLFALVRRNARQLNLPFQEVGQHLTNDAWVVAFNVGYSTNIIIGFPPAIKQCAIVVWSNGPNRHNDRGRVDDIVWPIFDIQSSREKGKP